MDAGLIEHIETLMERLASALLGAAAGFAVYRWLDLTIDQPRLALCSAGVAALAYLISNLALRSIMPRRDRFAVSPFLLREFDPLEADELILTDADRLETVQVEPEPLVLDDILAEIGPDARVVRLFDRKAMSTPMPTPGQLKSRIDDHLGRESAKLKIPDASEALWEALAELRRSLR